LRRAVGRLEYQRANEVDLFRSIFRRTETFRNALLGFLGFPPFALECYALVNLLTYFRRGRNWELTGRENRAFPGMSKKAIAACILVLPVFMAFAAYQTLLNVATYAEPINWHVELPRAAVQALRERNALQTHEFLKLGTRPPEIEEALWLRLQKLSRVSELKGMGIDKAVFLENLQIRDIKTLAKQEPDVLTEKLRDIGARVRPEETKVSISAARRAANN
jgi:hypothetical protein